MLRYAINFDKSDRKDGLSGPTATVHLSNSDCYNPNIAKDPAEGGWLTSDFLPEERNHINRDGVRYVVAFCRSRGKNCMINSQNQYEHSGL